MKSKREDYIQAIYRLSSEKSYTSNKEICNFLKLSKASVSEMLKKLRKESVIQEDKLKISLTEKGTDYAKKLLSKHRLWEYFLSRVLKMEAGLVHEQADLLEHVTSDELRDALNEYLDYPALSPHGKCIYENTDKLSL